PPDRLPDEDTLPAGPLGRQRGVGDPAGLAERQHEPVAHVTEARPGVRQTPCPTVASTPVPVLGPPARESACLCGPAMRTHCRRPVLDHSAPDHSAPLPLRALGPPSPGVAIRWGCPAMLPSRCVRPLGSAPRCDAPHCRVAGPGIRQNLED